MYRQNFGLSTKIQIFWIFEGTHPAKGILDPFRLVPDYIVLNDLNKVFNVNTDLILWFFCRLKMQEDSREGM